MIMIDRKQLVRLANNMVQLHLIWIIIQLNMLEARKELSHWKICQQKERRQIKCKKAARPNNYQKAKPP